MKKLFTLLIICLAAHAADGQTWAPTGAKWSFGVAHPFSTMKSYCAWVVKGDTIVDGIVCRLSKVKGTAVDYRPEGMITYEDSNRVYIYNRDKFTVLYDFNKVKGESWIYTTDTCDLVITVDSTATEIINGFPLKAMYLSSDMASFSGKVLEHIGHVFKPYPNVDYHCFDIIADVSSYYYLRCYEDSVFGFHSFDKAPSCDYVTDIRESEKPFGSVVFPNPADSRLNVRVFYHAPVSYTVYDLFGRVVLGGVMERELSIPLEGFRSGWYTLALTDNNNNRELQRFIVAH